eukprot:3517358-Alexandrium_andersonii.AAC.1
MALSMCANGVMSMLCKLACLMFGKISCFWRPRSMSAGSRPFFRAPNAICARPSDMPPPRSKVLALTKKGAMNPGT